MTKPGKPLPWPLIAIGFVVAGLILASPPYPAEPWPVPVVAPAIGPRYTGGGEGITIHVTATPVDGPTR